MFLGQPNFDHIMSLSGLPVPFDVWCVIASYSEDDTLHAVRMTSKVHFRYLSANDVWDILLKRDFAEKTADDYTTKALTLAEGCPKPNTLIDSMFTYCLLMHGNVRVRMRPPNQEERKLCGCQVCAPDDGASTVPLECKNAVLTKEVHDQADMFNGVNGLRLCRRFRRGMRHTFIAYGEGGSGKTHTLFGDLSGAPIEHKSLHGLCPKLLSALFATGATGKVAIGVAILDNKKFYDLLHYTGAEEERDEPDFGDGMSQPANLVRQKASNYVEAVNIIQFALSRGTELLTEQGTTLGRSCVIATIYDVASGGMFRFCDLPGSHACHRDGIRAREERCFVAGVLQSVITVAEAVGNHDKHIPLHSSKLTRTLTDVFTGRSSFDVIFTISPAGGNVSETLSTLTVAQQFSGLGAACRVGRVSKVALRSTISDAKKSSATKKNASATKKKTTAQPVPWMHRTMAVLSQS